MLGFSNLICPKRLVNQNKTAQDSEMVKRYKTKHRIHAFGFFWPV